MQDSLVEIPFFCWECGV